MPAFAIHIGDRELVIKAPSIGDALNTAMEHMPGAIVHSSAMIPDDIATMIPESEETADTTDGTDDDETAAGEEEENAGN